MIELLKKARETENVLIKDTLLDLAIAELEQAEKKVTVGDKVDEVKAGFKKFGNKLPKVNVEFRHKKLVEETEVE